MKKDRTYSITLSQEEYFELKETIFSVGLLRTAISAGCEALKDIESRLEDYIYEFEESEE